MPVIVRDVVIQHRPQVPRPGDQHPIGALGRTVRTHLSAKAQLAEQLTAAGITDTPASLT
jgi:hypothetical protein